MNIQNTAKNEAERYQQLVVERNEVQLKLKTLTKDNLKLKGLNKDEQSEKWRLLVQLHKCQEALEQKIVQLSDAKKRISQYELRIESLLGGLDDYWEFDSITVETCGIGIWNWTLTHMYFGDRLIPRASFQIIFENDMMSISLFRATDGSPTIFSRWPILGDSSNELRLCMTDGQVPSGPDDVFSAIGTKDWAAFKKLIKQISRYSQRPEFQNAQSDGSLARLQRALESYQNGLLNWPLVFRYDDVTMEGAGRNQGYSWVDIKLSNISIGSDNWQSLSYRLSTVDGTKGEFGSNPRLEFWENTCLAIQGWYAESEDDRGERLELRFAKPNAFDENVWGNLTPKDQILITGIISTLSRQLKEIADISAKANWSGWEEVASTLRNSLIASYKRNTRTL